MFKFIKNYIINLAEENKKDFENGKLDYSNIKPNKPFIQFNQYVDYK